MHVKTRTRMLRPMALMLSVAALFGLSACEPNTGKTAGQQLDTVLARTGQAAETAAAKTSAIASETKARIEASPVARDAAAAIGEAGGKMSRAADDAAITATISAGLAKDPELSAAKIDVDTQSGKVILTGPAPSDAAKARAEELARRAAGVTAVDNRLEIRG
ncbi:MAG: BON domain-containing protein [Comamonadaceae bacterium]|nr:MAG: BON domain-containing protein [Comamonadaceae bacterium]